MKRSDWGRKRASCLNLHRGRGAKGAEFFVSSHSAKRGGGGRGSKRGVDHFDVRFEASERGRGRREEGTGTFISKRGLRLWRERGEKEKGDGV